MADELKMVDSGGETLLMAGTSLLVLPLLLFNAVLSASGVSKPEGAKVRYGPRAHESLEGAMRTRKAREQKYMDRHGTNLRSSANVMKDRMKHLNVRR